MCLLLWPDDIILLGKSGLEVFSRSVISSSTGFAGPPSPSGEGHADAGFSAFVFRNFSKRGIVPAAKHYKTAVIASAGRPPCDPYGVGAGLAGCGFAGRPPCDPYGVGAGLAGCCPPCGLCVDLCDFYSKKATLAGGSFFMIFPCFSPCHRRAACRRRCARGVSAGRGTRCRWPGRWRGRGPGLGC